MIWTCFQKKHLTFFLLPLQYTPSVPPRLLHRHRHRHRRHLRRQGNRPRPRKSHNGHARTSNQGHTKVRSSLSPSLPPFPPQVSCERPHYFYPTDQSIPPSIPPSPPCRQESATLLLTGKHKDAVNARIAFIRETIADPPLPPSLPFLQARKCHPPPDGQAQGRRQCPHCLYPRVDGWLGFHV